MSTKIATTAGPPTPRQQKIILAVIFETSDRNPGVGLELMICIF